MWKYLQLQPSHSKHGTSLMAMFVGLGVFLIPLMVTHVEFWQRLNEPEVSQFNRELYDLKDGYRSLEHSVNRQKSLSPEDLVEVVFRTCRGRYSRNYSIPSRALDDGGEARIQAALNDYNAWICRGVHDNMTSLEAMEEGKDAELHFNFAEGAPKLEAVLTVATAELNRPVILRPELFFEMYLVGSPILFLAALFHSLLLRRPGKK